MRALLTEALLDWMDEDEDEDEDEERGPRAMIKAKVAEVEAALFDKFAGDTPQYRDKVLSLLSHPLSLSLSLSLWLAKLGWEPIPLPSTQTQRQDCAHLLSCTHLRH